MSLTVFPSMDIDTALYFPAAISLGMMNTIVNTVLSIVVLLIGLALGLLLRRLLVRRLAKTVLDGWIVQTLGVVVVAVALILAGVTVLGIWNLNLLLQALTEINKIRNITALLINVAETVLLIALGIGVARTIKNLTIRGLSENRIDINIRTLIGRIFYFIVLTFAMFWVLSIWQISIGFPVAAIGVLTVAVTVAIQDILKDLVAGFYILLERPFYIGDQISTTSGTVTYTGKVEDVQLRATKLRILSGEEVTIPNSLVFGNIVTNNTFYGERRITITVTLPLEEFSKEATPEQIITALKEVEGIMEKPEATAMFSSYAGSKITLTVRCWVASGQLSTVSDVMYALHTILPNAELAVREPVGIV